MTTAFWHFARGSEAAATGRIGIAEVERQTLEAARRETPADIEFSMFSNQAHVFLDLAANVLDARIATAHADRERAIEYWKNAVQIEDRLYYGQPPITGQFGTTNQQITSLGLRPTRLGACRHSQVSQWSDRYSSDSVWNPG
jgi:hypothetical protein